MLPSARHIHQDYDKFVPDEFRQSLRMDESSEDERDKMNEEDKKVTIIVM